MLSLSHTLTHACQQCHVSLLQYVYTLLQEGDAYQVVEGSQFIVSRTAFHDNSSHYQLNGRKVAFKEIAALLRSCGIDLDHNRFLILQVSKLIKQLLIYSSPRKSPFLAIISCLSSDNCVYLYLGVGRCGKF